MIGVPACQPRLNFPPLHSGARRMSPKGQRNNPRWSAPCRIVGLAILLMPVPARAGDEPIAPDHARAMARGLDLFKSGVRETLSTACLECHGGKATKADFDI